MGVTVERAWNGFVAAGAVLVALYVPYELVAGGVAAPLLAPAEALITIVFASDLVVRYRRADRTAPGRRTRLALDALAAAPLLLVTGNMAWLWLRPLKLCPTTTATCGASAWTTTSTRSWRACHLRYGPRSPCT